ncbi:TBC1 domain family member 19 [Cimex lectularius]|uniref:Rab-GAP TBC domain-containing protein n=1 Tax=Cimex lectularius TaxID=79782 RepID=A0A8I6S3R5_CIMLE|nr:TBC1 domain family member 19 [Cimex lectularius]
MYFLESQRDAGRGTRQKRQPRLSSRATEKKNMKAIDAHAHGEPKPAKGRCSKTGKKRLVSSSKVSHNEFRKSLIDAMKDTGVEIELRNTVYHWLRSHKYPPIVKEPLLYLRKAQAQWEKRIHKSLNSMAAEIKVSLSQMRTPEDRQEMHDKWNELSVYDIDLSQYRPVYAPKDFLEVLMWLRSPNYKPIDGLVSWEFIHLPFKVKNLKDLMKLYSEITRGESLMGIDPDGKATQYQNIIGERTTLGEKVISCSHAPVTQEFLKRGAPRSLRAKLWAQVLGAEVTPVLRKYWMGLKGLVMQYDLMVDKLIIKDVQLTASNDHQYFVFEDVLYQVMLCFSRDSAVIEVFNHSSASPLHGVLRGKASNVENTVIYPPSGVIPFHGFTMYATPFCYLYDDPAELYFVFRAFYLRYWFRLHEVSSHPQGILSLCLLYERLLYKHEQQLWLHFKRHQVQPVRLTFKWIMRAFSGHLPPEQVLYLWDMILGYDSMEILPLLAVNILSLRKDNLLSVNTMQNFESVLADLSSIHVMPIIQMCLLNYEKELNNSGLLQANNSKFPYGYPGFTNQMESSWLTSTIANSSTATWMNEQQNESEKSKINLENLGSASSTSSSSSTHLSKNDPSPITITGTTSTVVTTMTVTKS